MVWANQLRIASSQSIMFHFVLFQLLQYGNVERQHTIYGGSYQPIGLYIVMWCDMIWCDYSTTSTTESTKTATDTVPTTTYKSTTSTTESTTTVTVFWKWMKLWGKNVPLYSAEISITRRPFWQQLKDKFSLWLCLK